jgi:hypothetical protein
LKKWRLDHLPDGTSEIFTTTVVPMAKIKAGTISPWKSLSAAYIQEILDKVFGKNLYEVQEGDVWCDLVSSHRSFQS